jgi:hypothetical protein
MKLEVTQPTFSPVSVKFYLESQEELYCFYKLIQNVPSHPDSFLKIMIDDISLALTHRLKTMTNIEDIKDIYGDY